MDANETSSLTVSSDSGDNVAISTVESEDYSDSVSEDSLSVSNENESEIVSVSNEVSESSLSSNENSENEVLSTSDVSDSDSLSASDSTSASASKTKTTLKGSSSSITSGNKYTVTLTDASGKALASQKVIFNIAGKSYTKTTNSSGMAYLNVNLAKGTYALVCYYNGSSTYKSSALSLNLTVNKAKTTLKGNGTSVIKSSKYGVTLTDASGKALANKTVVFKIYGKSYSKTTNSNGVAYLSINLAKGTYSLVCSYAGSYQYYSSKFSTNLTVNTVKTTLKGNGTSIVKGNKYAITLTNSSGKALANQKVKFTICGKTYTRTTDSNGKAYLSINLAKGTYSLVCSFAGNGQYAASKLSLSLSVANNPNLYTLSAIESAASSLKAYVLANKTLPSTVTVSGNKLSIAQFSYLMAKAINNLNSGSSSSVTLLSGINSVSSSTNSLNATVYKAQYVNLTKRVVSYIESNKAPASYAVVYGSSGSSVGKASFNVYTFAFAKILTFYKTNNYLPNYCTFESSVIKNSVSTSSTNSSSASNSTSSSTSSSVSNSSSSKVFSLSSIETAANTVKTYVLNNKKLPNTVTVSGTTLTIEQFSYVMAKAIYNLNKSSSSSVTLLSGISDVNSANCSLNSTVYRAQYMNLTNRVISYISSNKVPASYAVVYSSSGSSVGKAGFDLYTFAFAKILVFYKTNGYLPNYCTFESDVLGISSSSSSSSSASTNTTSSKVSTANSSQFKTGLNEANTVSNLSAYLVGTGYSAITTAIKNKATALTKGLTSDLAKAKAIFEFVRDNISYSYYANSKKGASGTLSSGSANCCDQANLVVALCRAAGLYARYSHAQGCTFTSGLVTGHVWAQILVDGVWYSADATSSRNQLGNIKNWNTNSFYSLKQYAALSF